MPNKNAHKGEEFFYVLEGTMKVVYDGQEHLLEAGDGFYFNSSYEHQTIPVSDIVKVLDIMI